VLQQVHVTSTIFLAIHIKRTFCLAAAGSELLERSLAAIADDEAVVSAFLHVHTPNTEAVTFYTRHGFVVGIHAAVLYLYLLCETAGLVPDACKYFQTAVVGTRPKRQPCASSVHLSIASVAVQF
jgi:hypothetical protein